MDKKIKEIQDLQKLIDHRTEVEDQAAELISQCRFEEAPELLATLDGCEDPDPEPVPDAGAGKENNVVMYLKVNKTQLYKLFQCYYPDIPVFSGHEFPMMKHCRFKKFFRSHIWELSFCLLGEDPDHDLSSHVSLYVLLGVPHLQVSVYEEYGNPIFSQGYDLTLDEVVKRGMVKYREVV